PRPRPAGPKATRVMSRAGMPVRGSTACAGSTAAGAGCVRVTPRTWTGAAATGATKVWSVALTWRLDWSTATTRATLLAGPAMGTWQVQVNDAPAASVEL